MKYNTISIDPPWPIKKIQRKSRPNQKKLDYKTMTIDEIKNFPINDFAADNCIIFLWTINKYLHEAFHILENWGFNYQRLLTWDKKNGLCLFGFHHRTEFVLVGYKGKIEMFPKRKAIPTIFSESSWKKHSRKPTVFFELLKILPEPRISIFEREIRDGFDGYGDEYNITNVKNNTLTL